MEPVKQDTQDLWDQWNQDYLKQLQRFHHWRHRKRSVQVGDVMLLKDNELFHISWPLAVVEQVHPGTDGLVRVITLRTEKGTYKRAVTRLVPLLREEEPAALSPPPGCSGLGPSQGNELRSREYVLTLLDRLFYFFPYFPLNYCITTLSYTNPVHVYPSPGRLAPGGGGRIHITTYTTP